MGAGSAPVRCSRTGLNGRKPEYVRKSVTKTTDIGAATYAK